MIRERRNKDKLQLYYQDFLRTGKPDPNVHPWVAESWLRSLDMSIPTKKITLPKLAEAALSERQAQHQIAIKYMNGLYKSLGEYLNKYNISMLLSDKEGYVLKNYTLPFLQNSLAGMEGYRISEQDIGTSSLSIALYHKVPFLVFGPEMWLANYQAEDSCSAPIIVDDKVAYVISMVYAEQHDLPYSAAYSLLLSVRYALEEHLKSVSKMKIMHTILDALPLAVYQIQPDSKITFTNKAGRGRIKAVCPDDESEPYLDSIVLNYRHTPIEKGFFGIPAINKEVTWITANKTYEDITTVIPVRKEDYVNSVVAVTLPIEDLRSLVAHAAGYRARYTLAGMVGNSPVFIAMMDKALRVAKNQNHILLQGEAGTGKQRLAHGIHQASSRAAGPFITVRCGDMPPDLMENDLFGNDLPEHTQPGKLDLANGGTLFLDEVEELPIKIATRLYKALMSGEIIRTGESVSRPIDVRVIAACDSDLKRLTDKGVFCSSLYGLLSKTTLRVPSLRDRPSDIPIIADHIISELAEQHQLPAKHFAPETVELLMTFDWPGNVKELQSTIEHAFFNASSSLITPEDIEIPHSNGVGMGWKKDKELFIDVWKAAGGNISRLAAMLGVSRVTLYRYLKKYGLENSERRT